MRKRSVPELTSPALLDYLTTWYKRSECQFRIGFFFSAATMAGAFGGLFAFALTKLDGKAGLKGAAQFSFPY